MLFLKDSLLYKIELVGTPYSFPSEYILKSVQIFLLILPRCPEFLGPHQNFLFHIFVSQTLKLCKFAYEYEISSWSRMIIPVKRFMKYQFGPVGSLRKIMKLWTSVSSGVIKRGSLASSHVTSMVQNKQTNRNRKKKQVTTSWWEGSEHQRISGLVVCTLSRPSWCDPPTLSGFLCISRLGWAPITGLIPVGPVCQVGTSWLHTFTSSYNKRGQSVTRQALVPERRKECLPPPVNGCGCSHCLPWKPHSLKYKILCQGRCTIWEVFQIHHWKAQGIQHRRLRGSFCLCVSLPGWQGQQVDSCPEAG